MRPGPLHQLRARVRAWLSLRVGLMAVGALLTAALLAILLDAAVDLPEGLRLAAPWMLTALLIVTLVRGFVEMRRLDEARVARLFECRDARLGNRLINAVQLARRTGATPNEEFLRSEAVRLGEEAATRQRPWCVVRQTIQRWAFFAVADVIAWLLLAIVATELIHVVLPRFLDPRGDHPPYSRLKIAVTPGASDVLYGGQLELRAQTRGRPADKLWLVARAGTNESRTAMFLAPDKTFFQTLVNLREPTEYFVTDGTARSRRFPITIRYTPRITSVELTEDFPEYTGKAKRALKLPDEPQSLPEGTRVTFRVGSNRPLKSGALELLPALGGKSVQVPLRPESAGTIVTGEFTLAEPVVFNLSVRDVGNLESAEPRRGRFNVLPDRPPRLFVVQPGRDAVATPSISIPVRLEATDDYGVSRLVWLRGFNHSLERPFKMQLQLKDGPQSVESAGSFELEKLGVQPGDVIEYYFEAADNYPKGPNVVFSRPFRLEIISKEQYEAILRQAAARKALFEPYFKVDAWLRRLAERARNLDEKGHADDAATRQQAAELHKEMEEFEKALSKVMQQALMFDVERSFTATLAIQHTRVGEAAADLKKALGSGLSAAALKHLSDTLTELSAVEDEQVEQPAQQIASVARVLAKADAFVKLSQQQTALAQMLRRFSENREGLSRLQQMEVQELAHRQELVREGFREMLKQLPDLVVQLPADADYDVLRGDVQKFLEAVSGARIEEDLNDAATALGQPDTITGYALAERAAEKMDKRVSKCEGMPDKASQCLTARFQPKLAAPGLGDTLTQILAAMGVGTGQGGRDGYSLFNEAVALYGPNVELAGEQAGGRGDEGSSRNPRVEQLAGDAADAGLATSESPGRVHLQTDMKFPLRYRDLVGEYFRVIAESEKERER